VSDVWTERQQILRRALTFTNQGVSSVAGARVVYHERGDVAPLMHRTLVNLLPLNRMVKTTC
jgi:hypothetical protein